MPTFLSNSQFQMTVNDSADQSYTVQMSTNLSSTNWVSLWVTNSSSTSFVFTDINATNRERFYRVMGGP